VDRVVASPLNVGWRHVRSAHGVYPVPAPPRCVCCRDAPVTPGRTVELVTPTGALLITGYATEFGRMPRDAAASIGTAPARATFADTPNVLRVVLGDADAHAARAMWSS
jgi:uncharacterized protein (DUF111 family)